jgi:hypothetical protein
MHRATNAAVWGGIMTGLLGIGGTVLATTRATNHGPGYHWYCDPLLWVGAVCVVLGVYVALKLFKFPGLWLPDVKSQQRITFDFAANDLEGQDNSSIVRVEYQNHEKYDLHNVTINVILDQNVVGFSPCAPSGIRTRVGEVLDDDPENLYWVHRVPSIPGHGTKGHYLFRVDFPTDTPTQTRFEFLFISEDLHVPVGAGVDLKNVPESLRA